MYTKIFIFEKNLVRWKIFWYNEKRKMISNLFLLFFAEKGMAKCHVFFTLLFFHA